MVRKLVVLGKEIELHTELPEEVAKERWLSIVRDADPELAEEIEKVEHEVRVEGDVLVVYRLGAVFG